MSWLNVTLKLVRILSEFIDVASTINKFTFNVVWQLFLIIFLLASFTVITEEPEFTEIIENVTVPAGNHDSFNWSNDLDSKTFSLQEGMLNWRVL